MKSWASVSLAILAGALFTPAVSAQSLAVERSDVSPRKAEPSSLNPYLRNDYEKWRARTREEGFSNLEQEVLSSLGSGDNAVADAVLFYMANGLFLEALVLMRSHNEDRANKKLTYLEGVSNFQLGRWRDAITVFSEQSIADLDAAAPWRGMAKVKLGAYDAALRDLFGADEEVIPPEQDAANYYLAKASAALSIGDEPLIRNAFERLRRQPLTDVQRSERRYLEALSLIHAGNSEKAIPLLEALVRNNAEPFAALGALELYALNYSAGILSADQAEKQIEELRLKWSGGLFERRALAQLAEVKQSAGDFEGAFNTRRELVSGHPDSDISAAMEDKVRADLVQLFADEELSALYAATIFYQNIDFAPPGREGDQLIRGVVDHLAALELHSEAAELLEHQVFHRLKGRERSIAAAQLAELYLKLGEPEKVFATLDKTQYSRLPASIDAQRNHLRAQALVEEGEPTRALESIADDNSAQAAIIRGDITWSNDQWLVAAESYAEVLVQESEAIPSEHLGYILKAASAYVLGSDESALQSFVAEVSPRIEDDSVLDILRRLNSAEFGNDPEAFMAAYKALTISAPASAG